MNKLIATLTISTALFACATTGRQLPTNDSSTGARLVIDSSATSADGAEASQFPALVGDATLPRTGRHQQALLSIRDRFELAVNVCVAPDGSVASAQLDRSTGAPELDDSAQQDIAGWRFEPYNAPEHIRVCKELSIAYRPAVALGAR